MQARVLYLALYIPMAPKVECVYIRQSTSACVVTNMLHFQDSKNLPKPVARCSVTIVIDVDCDCFSILIMFCNVCMINPIQ